MSENIWIACKDRLPRVGETVLAAWVYGGGTDYELAWITIYEDGPGWNCEEALHPAPDYWQPLTDPRTAL
jgi:hypothetical protein